MTPDIDCYRLGAVPKNCLSVAKGMLYRDCRGKHMQEIAQEEKKQNCLELSLHASLGLLCLKVVDLHKAFPHTRSVHSSHPQPSRNLQCSLSGSMLGVLWGYIGRRMENKMKITI